MQTFYTVYVVDRFQHLISAEAITQLLFANKQPFISEMINPDVSVMLIITLGRMISRYSSYG